MPKICLDAGHFGKQNYNPKTTPVYWESLMAWDLHLMLKEELEKYKGITVITTRQVEEKDMELTARGRAAVGCDLFLSIHSNSVGNPTYNDPTDRAVVIYPVSGKEYDLAGALAQVITETMELHDKPQLYLRWNSSHNADYYGVIRGAAAVGVPGLILEHSFHTNQRAAYWLMNTDNLRKLAQAEAKAIAARYKCKLANEAEDAPLPGLFEDTFKTPFRVKVGAFDNPTNAINMLDELHSKGFDQAYIEDATGKVVMY